MSEDELSAYIAANKVSDMPFEYKPSGFEKYIGRDECRRIQRALYEAIYDPPTCPHCGAVKRDKPESYGITPEMAAEFRARPASRAIRDAADSFLAFQPKDSDNG